MNDEIVVLLIGRTGNGKSTIGNVICGKNCFKESELGVSETKNFQSEVVIVDGQKYRIVDTIGIGDTNLSVQEVLLKIADAAYTVRGGVHQVIFVTRGRFTEEEIVAYDLLRSVIFNNQIVGFTTVVRTHFPSFRNVEKCELDVTRMKQENGKLSALLNNCRKIMHVNNLTIEEEPDQKSRADSRTRLLLHLRGCREIYHPVELDQLNNRIKDYMTEKQLLEKKIEEINKKLAASDKLTAELKANLEGERKQHSERMNALKEAASKQTGMQIREKNPGIFEFIGGALDNIFGPIKKCTVM